MHLPALLTQDIMLQNHNRVLMLGHCAGGGGLILLSHLLMCLHVWGVTVWVLRILLNSVYLLCIYIICFSGDLKIGYVWSMIVFINHII